MSSSEMQPSYNEKPQADELEQFAALKCRAHIGRLFAEANKLGGYVVINPFELELTKEITELESTNFNDLGIFIRTREFANFFIVQDQDTLAYRIRNDVITQVGYDNVQRLRREFWLVYGEDVNGALGLSPFLSTYDIQISPITDWSEGLTAIYNEGDPLQQCENELFIAGEKEATFIKGFHLNEIEQLAIRTLDAVRANT